MDRDVPPERVLLAKDLRTVSKEKVCITKAEETLQVVIFHRERLVCSRRQRFWRRVVGLIRIQARGSPFFRSRTQIYYSFDSGYALSLYGGLPYISRTNKAR